jgi:hypothetical protein
MQDIPEDVFQIILSYCTNNYRDLVKFSQVNKSWKYVCDHCFLWQLTDLKFSLQKDGILQGIVLFSEDFKFRRNISKVVVYESRDKDFELKKEIILNKSFQENCFTIKKWFISMLVEYKKLRSSDKRWEQVVITHYESSSIYWKLGIFFLIPLIVCRFKMDTLFRTPNHSWGPTLFFCSCYIFLFSYYLFLFSEIVKSFAYRYLNKKKIYYNHIQLNLHFISQYLFFFLFFLGFILTIALIQWKLMCWQAFSWSFTILPMWITFSLAMVWTFYRKYHKKTTDSYIVLSIVGFMVFSIPFSCWLVAKYYDQFLFFPEETSPAYSSYYLLQYATIALMPIFVCSFIVLIFRVYNIAALWEEYRTGQMIIFRHLICNLLSRFHVSTELYVLCLKTWNTSLFSVFNGMIIHGIAKALIMTRLPGENNLQIEASFIHPRIWLYPLVNTLLVFHIFLVTLLTEINTIQDPFAKQKKLDEENDF